MKCLGVGIAFVAFWGFLFGWFFVWFCLVGWFLCVLYFGFFVLFWRGSGGFVCLVFKSRMWGGPGREQLTSLSATLERE